MACTRMMLMFCSCRGALPVAPEGDAQTHRVVGHQPAAGADGAIHLRTEKEIISARVWLSRSIMRLLLL